MKALKIMACVCLASLGSACSTIVPINIPERPDQPATAEDTAPAMRTTPAVKPCSMSEDAAVLAESYSWNKERKQLVARYRCWAPPIPPELHDEVKKLVKEREAKGIY